MQVFYENLIIAMKSDSLLSEEISDSEEGPDKL